MLFHATRFKFLRIHEMAHFFYKNSNNPPTQSMFCHVNLALHSIREGFAAKLSHSVMLRTLIHSNSRPRLDQDKAENAILIQGQSHEKKRMIMPQETAIYDEFLFNTTTQLLKPLEGILTSCEEWTNRMDETADDTQKQLTRDIRMHGHHMLDLINDIRDYAESQTGRIIIDKKPADLGGLMNGVLEAAAYLVKNKPQVRIQPDIPASLPYLSIQPMRIHQVFLNLLHNAVKFTEAGTIQISVDVRDHEVIFQVKDTGIGIAKEGAALVLAPFQTALPESGDARVGLGLGLPICQYVVEAHQGKLWFESTEGKGATFSFSLPIEPTGA
jgi:two-component system, sensor histidine kinase ChiS